MQTAEPVRRTSEIEDVTNLYFIHAMANRLTPLLARLHVRPNAVSVTGMLCGILAGFAYFHYADTRFAIAGFVLMIAWHVMDGEDGQQARLTRSQSEIGKVLDGICDYVTFIAVYMGLLLTLSRQHHVWVWGLVAMAGVCHAVQAAAYEAQRQEYDVLGWGRKSKELPKPKAVSVENGRASRTQEASRLLHRLYARIQLLASGFSADFQEKMREILATRPDRAAAIRHRYRDVFAPPVRRWSVLSANYRTLGIFVCALFKAPLFYFLFEVIGFSVILAVLARQQRARHTRFLADLGAAD